MRNMKPKIYFRADGNTKIGLGHIIRSRALADMLNSHFECIFLVQTPSAWLAKQIQESFKLITLPVTYDYTSEAKFITEKYLIGTEIIVLDGYNFNTEYQKIIKFKKTKLVCIDDMHTFHFVADAIINHAGGIKQENYSAETYTKFYLGTQYALLRKPFIEAAKQQRKIEKIENVFICFGGSDSKNLTKKAVNACLKNQTIKKISVVLGDAYSHDDVFLKNKSKIKVHRNLSAQQLVQLMQKCQLAIVPASSISYEICAVGMFLIAGWYVENQKNIYHFLTTNNLAQGVDNFLNLENEIPNIDFKQEQLAQQRLFFNKNIDRRIKAIFFDLLITCRSAVKNDAKLFFDWVNEKSVRENSFNSKPIIWENHQKWFAQKIDDKNCKLFVFEYLKTPVGQVRVDCQNNTGWINYSVDKNFRGLSFGKIIIQKTIEQFPANFILNAQVKKENIASCRIFEALNFTKQEKETLFEYTLDL